jgi:hypothetical protein
MDESGKWIAAGEYTFRGLAESMFIGVLRFYAARRKVVQK